MTRDEMQRSGVLRQDEKGNWLLSIHAQPGAKKTAMVGLHGDRLKVRLAAPPVDGKANKVLIAWAAKTFGVSRSAVRLIRGQSSRQKTLLLELPPLED